MAFCYNLYHFNSTENTMRIKLKLQIQPEVLGRAIPINYQYELSAAIYRVLAGANDEYSSWLHENGFMSGGKKFKLFTYSRLIIPDYTLNVEQQRIIINSDHVFLYISFLPDKSTKTFLKGLFSECVMQIGDSFSAVQFVATDVDILPPEAFNNHTVFETLSPICVSVRQENGKPKYLAPSDSGYKEGILAGLLARYKAFYGADYGGEIYLDMKIESTPKSELVKIKAGTPQQTFVRGYRYRFSMSLPEELMTIAYECGIGEKGSLGFGMIKAL